MKTQIPTAVMNLNEFFEQGSTDAVLFEINGDTGEEFDVCDGDWVMLDRRRVPKKHELVVITDGEDFSMEYHQPDTRNGLRLVSNLSDKPSAKREVYGVVTFIVKPVVEIKR